jgi:hypothetical protein
VLLVLRARADGRVRLCGGAVDTRVGRPATTVARLIGAGAHAGARVLARLRRAGVLELGRRPTASGLAARGQIRIPAVAVAHRATGGAGASGTAAADPARAAVSDQAPAAAQGSQVTAVPEARSPEIAEPDGTADLHTTHAPVVTAGEEGEGSGVVSGEAASGQAAVAGGARGRATADARAGAEAARPTARSGARERALRAKEQTPSTSPAPEEPRAAGARTGAWRQEPVRNRVRQALAPVACVLDAMTPGQRAVAVRAAEVVLRDVAPHLLAARLAARIGPMSPDGPPQDRGVIRSPLAWLLSQLPSITLCGSCGIRTTTGAPSARGAVCDRCVRTARVRERGARSCPVCRRPGHGLDEGEPCGRCDHRQALQRAGDRAAHAVETVPGHRPGAGQAARRTALEAARTAAAQAERRGADPLLQELAARLAAQHTTAQYTATQWAANHGDGDRAGRGAPRANGPEGWHCADARCARRSTARRPDSGLCSSCGRAREHREARAVRAARLAAAAVR